MTAIATPSAGSTVISSNQHAITSTRIVLITFNLASIADLPKGIRLQEDLPRSAKKGVVAGRRILAATQVSVLDGIIEIMDAGFTPIDLHAIERGGYVRVSAVFSRNDCLDGQKPISEAEGLIFGKMAEKYTCDLRVYHNQDNFSIECRGLSKGPIVRELCLSKRKEPVVRRV